MKPRKFELIECPTCRCEYLPAEIYVPFPFFGSPKFINRDENGKIVTFENTSMDTQEVYTCDKCNTTFKINAKLVFTTEVDKTENFDEEYTSTLQKNVLFLEEN